MRKPRLKAKFGNRAIAKKKHKGLLLIITFIFFLLLIGRIVNCNIKPPLMEISRIEVKNIAVRAINEAIISELVHGIKYEDLFTIKTDKNNKITMLQANTMFMNGIASKTALSIQKKLRDVSIKEIEIPLGSILGSEIFANLGPRLHIKVLPMGTVIVDFITGFEDAGINQTRHKIYLAVNTQIKVVLPLFKDIVDVVTKVPVAETIIVGDIPQSYIFIPENSIVDIVPEKFK